MSPVGWEVEALCKALFSADGMKLARNCMTYVYLPCSFFNLTAYRACDLSSVHHYIKKKTSPL